MIILGIDLGKARTGVAVCDRAEMLASPLCVIQEHNRERLIEKIVKLSNERRAEQIALGLPKNMDGSEGESAQNAREFGALLQEKTGLPVAFVDERGTTVTAHGYLNQTDVRGKKEKAVVDSVAAVIIFTEFVATQTYLQELLVNRGYTVTILNGGMSIDERNAAMQEFKASTSIFISTDAGGEGLNLQFANIIINYDLPWNPMKIEQRCGRVDRIGQQRDVHIYNFIVGETVENRVREVLEEKLSVILKEMGVDKYSDVLDSEVAECDFTDVYMRSIGHASQVEKNLYPVEAEMKQQLTNAQKYKDVIREEKDLTKLVGTESNFDVDSALRTMLTYYECWQGHDPRLIDRISIADEEITQHLKTELVQDRTAPLMSIQIDNFPNEEGYFMLWELSISEKESGKRILPIFVNSAMVLRPMAGKRIMDVFLDGGSKLRVSSVPNVDAEIYSKLEKSCMDFAYDTFVELKEKQMQQNEESFKKYMYALVLRQEAAEHIGIENIRRSRLQKLQKEKANIEAQHRKGSQVYPDFRLIMMARLEA